MSDDLAALANFSGTARLFPLPSLVLFPNVIQRFNVFEPRYRQMTADALAGDGLIALVLLKQEAWEEGYDESPEIESVGCLTRIVQHELLPDGRYILQVRGLCRLRLVEELRTGKPYRTSLAELIPDVILDDLPRLTRIRHRLAEAVLSRFEAGGPAFQHLSDLFDSELPLGALCDMLSFALPLSMEIKQSLLEQPHVDKRAESLTRALEATKPITPSPLPGRKFPPDFSPN